LLRSLRYFALAGACFSLASLASLPLAACGPATPPRPTTSASSAPAGFAGYRWLVVSITHEGKVTSIPARLNVDLRFSPIGRFLADDSINSHSGTFRVTPGGFTTSDVASTAVGYAGHDPVILLSQGAMTAFGSGVQATVNVSGKRLEVSVGGYTLTCQRHGPAGNNR
jgi:heat shock protein HslJ